MINPNQKIFFEFLKEHIVISLKGSYLDLEVDAEQTVKDDLAIGSDIGLVYFDSFVFLLI